MKIALCFSGQARSFSSTFHSFQKHVLRPLQNQYGITKIDIFGHAPKDSDSSKIPRSIFTEIVLEDESLIVPLIKEHSSDHEIYHHPWHSGGPLRAYWLQLRSLHKANQIKSEHEKISGSRYDWVFRLRYDNLFYGSNIERLSSLDANCLYVPVHDNWHGLNDRFGFGSSVVMDKYCERIKLLDSNLEARKSLHPERFLAECMNREGIAVQRTRICHHLLRHNQLWVAVFREWSGDLPAIERSLSWYALKGLSLLPLNCGKILYAKTKEYI